jgi:hypothetical protein
LPLIGSVWNSLRPSELTPSPCEYIAPRQTTFGAFGFVRSTAWTSPAPPATQKVRPSGDQPLSWPYGIGISDCSTGRRQSLLTS